MQRDERGFDARFSLIWISRAQRCKRIGVNLLGIFIQYTVRRDDDGFGGMFSRGVCVCVCVCACLSSRGRV